MYLFCYDEVPIVFIVCEVFFEKEINMKKMLAISLLSVVASTSALAAQQDGVSARFDVIANSTQLKHAGADAGSEAVRYGGVSFAADVDTAVSEKGTLGYYVEVGRTQKKQQSHLVKFNFGMDYAHHFQVSDDLTVAPRVAIGYLTNKLTDSQSSDKLKRYYTEAGVEARYAINDQISLTPSFAFQKDFYTRVNGLKAPKGHGFAVEMGVNTQWDSVEMRVAPYYKQYNLKTVAGKSSLNESGVKVGFSF